MADLGDRLRDLRLSFPVTQPQLAGGIGVEVQNPNGKPLSTSTISSWETGRLVPSVEQLAILARFYCTSRSLQDEPHLVPVEQLDGDEQARCQALEAELIGLRPDGGRPELPNGLATAGGRKEEGGLLGGRIFAYPDGEDICVVASRLPPELLRDVDYVNEWHPNYIEMLTYADADALIEVFGHIRAQNPYSRVTFGTWDKVSNDQLGQHLVVLGGDWNRAAEWARRRTEIPVTVRPGDGELDGFFVVGPPGDRRELRPTLRRGDEGLPDLEYDVALFARGPSPASERHTLTLCQGLFSRGTYGAVRAFTDATHRQRNEEKLSDISENFGDKQFEWLMFRVSVLFGRTATPDLGRGFQRLAHGVQEQTPGGVRSHVTWLEGAENAPVVTPSANR